jgi:hypothetical protein
MKPEEAHEPLDIALKLLKTGLFVGAEASDVERVRKYLERVKNEISRLYSQAGPLKSSVSADEVSNQRRQGSRE